MYISTNQKELLQLAKYFYNITHTLISIYDQNKNLICSYPDTMCRFCTEVRKNPSLNHVCIQSDEAAFQVCDSTHKTHIYHCHMGLLEVATPIVYNNVILGYMLFGQITDEENRDLLLAGIEKAISGFCPNMAVIRASVPEIQYQTREYIESIAKLLEMCANYIWLNSIISVRKEGLAFSIELYIKENLHSQLSIPVLCRQFNIGRSTLYEISKNNFGCGINDYIQYQRNALAKELLKTENLSVSEIAEAVGIKDPNYFIRFFKKHNGCTPNVWRKQQL